MLLDKNGISSRKENYLNHIQGKHLQAINEDETLTERVDVTTIRNTPRNNLEEAPVIEEQGG